MTGIVRGDTPLRPAEPTALHTARGRGSRFTLHAARFTQDRERRRVTGTRYRVTSQPVLFHITHTHQPQQCLFEDPESLAATFGTVDAAMAKAGATVVGSWVNAAAHTFYWVVDAQEAGQITRGLAPIVTRGHADIRVVTDLQATIAMLRGE